MVKFNNTSPFPFDHNGFRYRVWQNPGLMTDFRPKAERPFLITKGVHSLAGFEIPFLPEPYPEDNSLMSRTALYQEHREHFLNEMLRMLRGLHDPVMWRGSTRELFQPLTTFDLRLINQPNKNDIGSLRLFLLIKSFVQVVRPDDEDKAVEIAAERTLAACQLCRAQAPRDLTLDQIFWVPKRDQNSTSRHPFIVDDHTLGLYSASSAIGELRRENQLSRLRDEFNYESFCGKLHESKFFGAPEPWPETSHDLLPTCKVMATSGENLVLSVRIQPTVRTQGEYKEIQKFLDEMRNSDDYQRGPFRKCVELYNRFLETREFFLTTVQIAGSKQSTIFDVMTTLAGEQMGGSSSNITPDSDSDPLPNRPARLLCLTEQERDIATFNLRNIDFLPWGAVSAKVIAAFHPGGGMLSDLPNLQTFVVTDDLRLPETYMRRDLEIRALFARMRKLLSIREAASVWKIPIASRIGQTGFTSRLPNPFQHFPSPSFNAKDSISLGNVDHLGSALNTEFRLPILNTKGHPLGLGGRILLVAGSPQSGTCSFAIHLLKQLWNKKHPVDISRQISFLVINVSNQGEYHQISKLSNDAIKIFTPNDLQGESFLLNPFIVPDQATIQSHLNRILPCFDFLDESDYINPKISEIFRAAIDRAYRKKTMYNHKATHPFQKYGSEWDEDYPTISDVFQEIGIYPSNEQNSILSDFTDITMRPRVEKKLRLIHDMLTSVFIEQSSKQGYVNLPDLLKLPSILELGRIDNRELLCFFVSILITCISEYLEFESKTTFHVLLIAGFDRLRYGRANVSDNNSTTVNRPYCLITQRLTDIATANHSVIIIDREPLSLLEIGHSSPYFIALHRLNDPQSFDRLANMLNLNQDQRYFARFSLRSGQFIVNEPNSNLPVLLRIPSINGDVGSKTI